MNLSPLWISLKTALASTLLAFFLGIFFAEWMYIYQGKWKKIIDSMLTIPLVLPPLVLGFLLLLALGKNSLFGQLLKHWEIGIIFSWQATVIAATLVAFPIMYKTVLAAFEQVDRNLVDCARTLGASEIRIFAEILLPLAWPGIMAGTSLSFARALGEFGATLMLAGNIPGKTQTIPLAIFFAAEGGRMQEALIWVTILLAIALATLISLQYWSVNKHQLGWAIAPRLSYFLISFLSQVFSHLNHKIHNTKKPPLTPIHSPDKTRIQLAVDIQKKLSGFNLKIHFQTYGNPLGILGASGSGKTMTLRCIAGLETPTQGTIILNGKVLFDSAQSINLPSRHRRIALLFQNYALFPHLQVSDNIGFGLSHLPKDRRNQTIQYYLHLMQLQGLENRYPQELSGGQQQRVALARALAISPDALLLDEPLSALDSYLRTQIEQLLVEISQTYSGALLLVTHKLEEAYRVCDHLMVLSQGKAIANGRKQDIFEHPSSYRVAQLTECKNFSAIYPIDETHIHAPDWGCTLEIIQPLNHSIYVGIRAHHLLFPDTEEQENTFPCWLVKTSETPHRMTLYLKLQKPQPGDERYHLQAEVFKEKWQHLKHRPFPWLVYLDPLRLMLMDS